MSCEDGDLKTCLRGGSMNEKLHSFINFGPIHLKLDFSYISELATYAKTLVWSKSRSGLGDTAPGSWKLLQNQWISSDLSNFYQRIYKGKSEFWCSSI